MAWRLPGRFAIVSINFTVEYLSEQKVYGKIQASTTNRNNATHLKTISERVLVTLSVVVFGMFAAQAETYYYVGNEPYTNSTWSAVSLWARGDGTASVTEPAAGDTIVFTNSMSVGFSGNATIPCDIIKRGTGEVAFNKALTMNGVLTLERGRFFHYNGGALAFGENFALKVAGTATKTFYLYGGGSTTHHTGMTIPSYSETGEAAHTMTFAIYGSTDFVTTLKGAANTTTRFSADIYPNNHDKTSYTLNWNPDVAATLEIVNREYYREQSKPRSYIKVSNGTVRFGEGSGVTRLDGIEVMNGATLEINAGAVSDTFSCPVTIEQGGKLKLSRKLFKPTSLTYNGVALADGRYSRETGCDWIEDDGVLVIGTGEIPAEPATTTATWDGGGADTLLTTDENWVGDIAPNLADGSLVATFPTGTEATVPAGETVAFKGISVSASSFTLKGGVGSKVTLGSSGVTVTSIAFTNECFTAITRSQTWDVAANCTNVWAAEVAADWPTIDTLTLTNNGVYVVLVSNPKLCDVNYFSTIEARADVPLGGHLVTAESKVSGKVVECYGNVFSNNFRTAINGHGNTAYHLFRIWSGANVFCGKVESAQVNGHFWRFADNNTKSTIDRSITATLKGGFVQSTAYNNNGTHFSPYLNGIVNIEDTPMSIVRMYIGWPYYYRQELNLNVSSNTTTRGIHIMHGSTLNTTVPYALYATDSGQSGVLLNDLATWNLSADQGVNVFGGITNTATVASETGATLHLRDDRLNTVKPSETQAISTDHGQLGTLVNEVSLTTSKVQTNKVVFAGNVNFSKEGVLDHWMEGVSTSTGSVTVKRGKLIFTTGSWRNASGVTVEGDGKIEMRNAAAFSEDTPFAFRGDSTAGMMVIPTGTTVKLATVTVNGKTLNGSFSSGLVTGGGTLLAGTSGFMVIFR